MNKNARAFLEESQKFTGTLDGDLGRMEDLMNDLGNPQDRLKVVHIGGTNGKGSVTALLSSVLQAEGYRTGVFTSPYLLRWNECMRINGLEISDEAMDHWLLRIQAHTIKMSLKQRPTAFEIMTGLAFAWFWEQKCDIVLMEVGLGGASDSTNVIRNPLLSVFTPISLDHTQILGSTVQEIAREKAGIIKPGTPVVTQIQPPEASTEIIRKCQAENAPVHEADPARVSLMTAGLEGQRFSDKYWGLLEMKLLGRHQLQNAALVLEIIDCLKSMDVNLSLTAVVQGFSKAAWPARFELICRSPRLIVDGAHNPQGTEMLAENISRYFPEKKVLFVAGMLRDKDWGRMLAPMMPLSQKWITVTPENPRAMQAKQLADQIRGFGAPAEAALDIRDAVDWCLQKEHQEAVICVFGSLYFVGHFRKEFLLAKSVSVVV